jgi:GT2 family glycosyltransferase
MLGLITVAYNQAEVTRRLVNSIDYDCIIHLFLHSCRPEVVATCRELARRPLVLLYAYGNNPGLARSWNEGIHDAYAAGCELVLVVNNDIEFAPGAINEMVKIARMHPEKYLITCGHGYSCFIIQPIAIKTIGYFDEAIKPAYYEDCDYARRARLAGLQSIDLPDLGVLHAENGTIKGERKTYKKKYRHDMARLRAYYRAKWGGGPLMKPDKEIYDKPFQKGELYCGY